MFVECPKQAKATTRAAVSDNHGLPRDIIAWPRWAPVPHVTVTVSRTRCRLPSTMPHPSCFILIPYPHPPSPISISPSPISHHAPIMVLLPTTSSTTRKRTPYSASHAIQVQAPPHHTHSRSGGRLSECLSRVTICTPYLVAHFCSHGTLAFAQKHRHGGINAASHFPKKVQAPGTRDLGPGTRDQLSKLVREPASSSDPFSVLRTPDILSR